MGNELQLYLGAVGAASYGSTKKVICRLGAGSLRLAAAGAQQGTSPCSWDAAR